MTPSADVRAFAALVDLSPGLEPPPGAADSCGALPSWLTMACPWLPVFSFFAVASVLVVVALWTISRRREPTFGRVGATLNAPGTTIPAQSDPPPRGTAYVSASLSDGTPAYFPLGYKVIHVGRAAGPGPSIVLDPSLFAGAEGVSERHARIEFDGREHLVVDAGSTNGLLVNGHRSGEVFLTDGAHIALGSLGLVYRANAPAGGQA